MEFLSALNDLLWSCIIIVVLVGAALWFTIKGRGAQFTLIKDAVRIMLGRDKNPQKGEETSQGKRHMGSFQAFAVSLASRVGTGNLAGVASAIFVGGPGAVFWMWVMALLGGATSFVESTLAQLYKRKGPDGFYGGPAFYMERGLGARWMGVLFSTLMVFSFGLSNQMVQTNTIVDSLSDSFGWGRLAIGLSLALVVFIISIGSIKAISRITSYLVPFMAIGFILMSFFVVITNLRELPGVFKTIIDGAFGLRQVGGGVVGAAILNGVKRGLFSNEAGEGSAPNAAAIAATSHPVKQGAVQALGVFIDTILICSCTALIILIAPEAGGGADGILLTSRCLEAELGSSGKWFLTVAIFLFAFSTLLSNYFYGENNIRFITKSMVPVWAFRVATAAICTVSSLMALQQIWTIMDIFMGLLTLTNVVAIVILSPKAFRLLEDYRRQRRSGLKDPVFNKHNVFPESEDDYEGWE